MAWVHTATLIYHHQHVLNSPSNYACHHITSSLPHCSQQAAVKVTGFLTNSYGILFLDLQLQEFFQTEVNQTIYLLAHHLPVISFLTQSQTHQPWVWGWGSMKNLMERPNGSHQTFETQVWDNLRKRCYKQKNKTSEARIECVQCWCLWKPGKYRTTN